MLFRSYIKLLSSAGRSDCTLLRASIYTTGPHQVKKNTDTTTAPSSPPAKGNTGPSKNSTESYASGEMFFSHNPYSFYDSEIDMAKDRIQQPSSKPDKKPLGS